MWVSISVGSQCVQALLCYGHTLCTVLVLSAMLQLCSSQDDERSDATHCLAIWTLPVPLIKIANVHPSVDCEGRNAEAEAKLKGCALPLRTSLMLDRWECFLCLLLKICLPYFKACISLPCHVLVLLRLLLFITTQGRLGKGLRFPACVSHPQVWPSPDPTIQPTDHSTLDSPACFP